MSFKTQVRPHSVRMMLSTWNQCWSVGKSFKWLRKRHMHISAHILSSFWHAKTRASNKRRADRQRLSFINSKKTKKKMSPEQTCLWYARSRPSAHRCIPLINQQGHILLFFFSTERARVMWFMCPWNNLLTEVTRINCRSAHSRSLINKSQSVDRID